MPPFRPFPAIRYRSELDPADVTAPPYDVIDADDRATLLARSDRNVVKVDLPDEADGDRRYAAAAATFDRWRSDGTLVTETEPSLTVYRMSFVDDRGVPARTLGVVGALELSTPSEGHILPHEHTTPKAKTDRLDLLHATSVNLSPVWMLSLADGLTALVEPDGPPDAEWSDDDGVSHATWRVGDADRLSAISASVGSQPVVVADGHHRYETSLAYRDARRTAAGADAVLDSDLIMALVVELADDELTVRPIHRLVDGVTAPEVLASFGKGAFDILEPIVSTDDVAAGHVLRLMDESGALAVIDSDGAATLVLPRPEAFSGVPDLDSARLDHALSRAEGATSRPQHGADLVQRAVTKGEAGAGILLRPATVAQIRANAHSGERMPAKTTFFHPKPRTGVVFRAC